MSLSNNVTIPPVQFPRAAQSLYLHATIVTKFSYRGASLSNKNDIRDVGSTADLVLVFLVHLVPLVPTAPTSHRRCSKKLSGEKSHEKFDWLQNFKNKNLHVIKSMIFFLTKGNKYS